MTLKVESHSEANEVVIRLPQNFDFRAHKSFRDAFSKAVPDARYVVDLEQTQYLDSSALGMLMQLREHVGGDKNRVRLVNADPSIVDILKIANFDKLMTLC